MFQGSVRERGRNQGERVSAMHSILFLCKEEIVLKR
ncbi:hypothetical protein COLO4_32100 [Corchorus olitorius]|uniref:Uncharacterized protein n=1 Tax=Corchorus olitorius TaxID=93759 RepID=A0A1R3H1L7_9ROSI|nr:hypothetical protein COLO4_32100 [Corchorus olitorius]